MKQKIFALFLALALLMLSACASTGAEGSGQPEPSGTAGQPVPSGTPETASSDPPETKTDPAEAAQLVRFESPLGCSGTYDPALFTNETVLEHEQLVIGSIWARDTFNLNVRVTLLDVSSVEDAINDGCLGNLDAPHEVGVREPFREEATFGSGNYSAIHLTYNEVYAVGEIYLTEQNGSVYEVEISSYYQPPEELLAQAYAILDSITF